MAVRPDLRQVFYFGGIAPKIANLGHQQGAIWHDMLLAEALVYLYFCLPWWWINVYYCYYYQRWHVLASLSHCNQTTTVTTSQCTVTNRSNDAVKEAFIKYGPCRSYTADVTEMLSQDNAEFYKPVDSSKARSRARVSGFKCPDSVDRDDFDDCRQRALSSSSATDSTCKLTVIILMLVWLRCSIPYQL